MIDGTIKSENNCFETRVYNAMPNEVDILQKNLNACEASYEALAVGLGMKRDTFNDFILQEKSLNLIIQLTPLRNEDQPKCKIRIHCNMHTEELIFNLPVDFKEVIETMKAKSADWSHQVMIDSNTWDKVAFKIGSYILK